jgi:hypothetical protein
MYFNSHLSTKILETVLSYYRFPANAFAGSIDNIAMLKYALSDLGRREK